MGRRALLVVWALAAAAGCGRSSGNSSHDAADTRSADRGAETGISARDGGPRDAPAEQQVDARVDAPDERSSRDAADGSVDPIVDSARDTVTDAGRDATADGGCIAVPAPTVRWLNPLPQGNSLRGIWGSGPTDVYAVGDDGTILHSADHGQSWQAQASGTLQSLYGIWGSAANDVYAVGALGTILHTVDGGQTWTSMSIKTPQTLFAIWGASANDVYAVGTNGVIAHRIAGGAWTFVVQNYYGSSPNNRGVYGSGGTVWVVGDHPSVLTSIDGGATWKEAPTPNASSALYGITGAGGSLYIAVEAFSGYANFYVSADGGGTWNPVRTNDGQATIGLASAASAVYGVGTSGMFQVATGATANFSPLSTGTTQTLNGVWASTSGELFAVGDTGVIAYATSASATFSLTPAVTRETLARVWGSPQGDLIAVGYLPDVVQSSDLGAHFTLRKPTGANLPSRLSDVAGFGDEVYAVGPDTPNSTILRSGDRGVTWAADYTTSVTNIYAVTEDATGVYAAGPFGYGGTLFHKSTGGSWTTITVAGVRYEGLDQLTSIGGEIWGVGGDDILHGVAGAFSFIQVPRTGLATIWGTSTTNLIAAGDSAEIGVSTDHGASWTFETACWPPDQLAAQGAKATSPLSAICNGGGRTFIVGADGTLLVSRDEINWTSVPAGTNEQLSGCTIGPDGTLYVVGGGGAILAYTFPD